MKITKVTPRLIERAMAGNLWNPRTRWTRKRMVLVFIETDTGLFGVGEGWTSGGSARALVDTIEDDLAPLLLGQDPHFVTRFAKQALETTENSNRPGIMGAAFGAVDTALWDLIGKAARLPLYRLLGAYDEKVFTYASAGLYGENKGPDDLGAELRGYIEPGLHRGQDEGRRRAAEGGRRQGCRRRARRSARTPGSWSMRSTISACPKRWRWPARSSATTSTSSRRRSRRATSGARREVHAKSPIPVCGNETLAWTGPFRELITRRAVHFVQFDPAVCGGITEGRRIADLAAAFHLPCTLHASSTSVLFAACLHLGAALANCASVEYHMLHQWFWDLEPEDTFIARDGFVRPPEGPGLGLAITPDDVGDA